MHVWSDFAVRIETGIRFSLRATVYVAYAWISDINLLPILWNTCIPVYNDHLACRHLCSALASSAQVT